MKRKKIYNEFDLEAKSAFILRHKSYDFPPKIDIDKYLKGNKLNLNRSLFEQCIDVCSHTLYGDSIKNGIDWNLIDETHYWGTIDDGYNDYSWEDEISSRDRKILEEMISDRQGITVENLAEAYQEKYTSFADIVVMFPEEELLKVPKIMDRAALMAKFVNEQMGSSKYKDTESIRQDISMVEEHLERELEIEQEIIDLSEDAVFENIGKVSKDMAKVLDKMSLVGELQMFRQKTNTKPKLDPSSDIVNYKAMDSFGDLVNSSLMDRILPTYKAKMIKKELFVRKRVAYVRQKQDIIIMIDDSGSMREAEKVTWLNAIILNRLREVRAGRANVYISSFVVSLRGFRKLEFKDGDRVHELINSFFSLNGGGTDIEGCVRSGIEQIKNGQLIGMNGDTITLNGVHPEILVVNDGQDSIRADYHPDIKLNAVCLYQDNKELRNICNRSGGYYINTTEELDRIIYERSEK